MFCTDGIKYYCFPILVGIIIDYKEQVFITGTKANVQYLVCHIIRKLVAPIRVFCMELLPCKYSYHPIIKYFALTI